MLISNFGNEDERGKIIFSLFSLEFHFTGHILDDQDLVETLQKSKVMAEEIYHRVSQSEETEKKLSVARKRYLPVSLLTRCTVFQR